MALLAMVRPVTGMWTTVVTDSAYLVSGSSLPRQALLAGSNFDIWDSWHTEIYRRGGRVFVCKVRAHSSLADVAAGVLSLRDYWGNLLADRVAAQAASFHQLPFSVVSTYQIACATAVRVMEHVVRAHIVAMDQSALLPVGQIHVPQVLSRRKCVRVVSRAAHRVVFSNGYAATPSGVGWRCSSCRLYRKSVEACVWTNRCVSWA